MQSAKRARLDELDDPLLEDAVLGGVERVTAPPPFEPTAFAQQVEGAGERMTLPPVPAFEMLRDSCKIAIDELDEITPERKRIEDEADAVLHVPHASSHVKIKTP